jgi:hypothetical protein
MEPSGRESAIVSFSLAVCSMSNDGQTLGERRWEGGDI